MVLRAVAESEPVRTTALAEQVGVDPSTMSRHVTVLDQAGYVTRTADPDDGRAQAIALTPAGREVMENVRTARHDLITDVLAALGRRRPQRTSPRCSVVSPTTSSAWSVRHEPRNHRKGRPPLQVDGAVEHDARHVHGHARLVDRADLAAGDLPRHPPRPAAAGNVSYLLWMLMGYLVVTAVLVVTFGRLGDMFGRVRMYNAGLRRLHARVDRAVAHARSRRRAGALWLIVLRVVQGIGGALLMANSTAILTDAFPADAARHGPRAST